MYRSTIKRALDICVSALLLPVIALVGIVVGVLIKLDDGGSVIYSSTRLGRKMKPFTLYKFRSMRVGAPDVRNSDGSTFSAADDPRVSKAGRFLRRTSLDELPQLINVLKGDMSLIGPRPSPLGNEHTYSETFKRKFEVLPGITGYSQAYFRNSDTLEERTINDVHYVEHISFGFDTKIIFRTMRTILKAENLNRG